MKKKLLAMLLAVCMVLSLAPAAFAAEGDGDGAEADEPATSAAPADGTEDGGTDDAPADEPAGDTAPGDGEAVRHFEDQYHAGLSFSEMEYTPVSAEEFLAAVEEATALLDDAANAEKVEELFKTVSDMYMTVRANMTLLNIYMVQDTTDEELSDRYDAEYEFYIYTIYNPFLTLVQDIVKSPCRDYFVEQEKLTEDDVASYLEFVPLTEEEMELLVGTSSIDSEYWAAYADESMTFDYNGTTWDFTSLAEAMEAGEIDGDAYAAIYNGLEETYYQNLGAVYMKAMEQNNAVAAADGTFDNYADYAYEYVYSRDYTAQDVEAFAAAVKEYIVPLVSDLWDLYGINANKDFDTYAALFNGDYTSDEVLDAIRPYIAEMSDELLESWDYMIDHDLYDIVATDTKADQGFTTTISKYGAPFFFNSPYGYVLDFSTILHEFGHYNNAYWHPSGWNDGSCSIDVAEVHSQSLELLFTQYYGDFFATAGDAFSTLVLYNIVGNAIITGSLFGELEVYAYTTPDVTLEDICDKYVELCAEYQYADENPYGWLLIHHLTTQPMYYISYATSAIGALYFYSYALENGFDEATDLYLEFVSQSPYEYYTDQFETVCGVNPMDPEYVAEIADTLYADLNMDAILYPVFAFEDADPANPLLGYINELVKRGGIAGSGDNKLHLEEAATRAQFAQMLYNMFGIKGQENANPLADIDGKWYHDAAAWTYTRGVMTGSPDADGSEYFHGDDPLTCETLAVVLCRILNLFGVDTTPTDNYAFADRDEISPWALDAMDFCYENGLLDIDDETFIEPKQIVTRDYMFYYVYLLFVTVNG